MWRRSSIQTGVLALVIGGSYLGWLYDFVPDDAYFYIEPAWNHALGHGITFDGYHDTNGFHPLWMGLLVLLAELMPGKLVLLATIGVMSVGLACTIPWLFRWSFKESDALKGLEWAAALPVLVFGAATQVVGTEAILNAALLVGVFGAMAHITRKGDGATIREFALVGLLLGIAMLARLDNVFLGASLAFWVLHRSGLRDAAVLAGAASGAVIPYLVWNQVVNHNWVPISGQIKSSLPSAEWIWDLMPVHGVLIIISLIVAAFVHIWRKEWRLRGLYNSFVVGACLQTTYHWAFSDFTTSYWYAILAAVTAGIATALVASIVWDSLRKRFDITRDTYLVFLSSGALLVLATVFGLKVSGARYEQLEAINALNERINQEDRLVAVDVGGRLGYYGNFWVLPLDGLILNKAYQDNLVEQGVQKTFKAAGVDYVLFQERTNLAKMQCQVPGRNKDDECRTWLLSFRSSLHDKSVGSYRIDASQIVWTQYMEVERRDWTLIDIR